MNAAIKKIDTNKLSADFADFERIYNGDDFVICESIEQIEFPKLPRKKVASLCLTNRAKSICRDAAEFGWWSNGGVSFPLREGCDDLQPDLASMEYRKVKNMEAALTEHEISCRETKVKILGQSSNEIMLANGDLRIVVQKRFLLLIIKFGIGEVSSFTVNREFTCLSARNENGESLGLIMALNRQNNPGWSATDVKDKQEQFSDRFKKTGTCNVVFDKARTENGLRIMRVRFVSFDYSVTIFEASKKEYGDWRLQHKGTMSVSFDNLRKLKKFCETMAVYMVAADSGFVEFNSIRKAQRDG